MRNVGKLLLDRYRQGAQRCRSRSRRGSAQRRRCATWGRSITRRTNRRDAVSLARLLRANELTPVWVPDETHEAVRDLARTRCAAAADYRRKRQQTVIVPLRHGRHFPGKPTWRGRHLRWLDGKNFAHPAQRLAFQEMLNGVRESAARPDRFEAALAEIVPSWLMALVVAAFQAMRGVAFLTAAALAVEAGDIRRFANPRRLMAFLGLVPSERSTGNARHRGGITKTGNIRARKGTDRGGRELSARRRHRRQRPGCRNRSARSPGSAARRFQSSHECFGPVNSRSPRFLGSVQGRLRSRTACAGFFSGPYRHTTSERGRRR